MTTEHNTNNSENVFENAQIDYHQAFPVLKVNLPPHASIKANGISLIAMSNHVRLTGKMEGGVLGSLWRSFSGESFFLQRYEASEKGGWVWLGPNLPGSIQPLALDGKTEWLATRGAFLAGGTGIEVSTKVQNLTRGLFSGEGLFVVRLSGAGPVYLSTFGGIETVTLQAGEECIVDFGRIVAWPASMAYDITIPAKGLWSAITTGEILGCRFRGPGTIYLQTLSSNQFGMAAAQMLSPYFKTQNNG